MNAMSRSSLLLGPILYAVALGAIGIAAVRPSPGQRLASSQPPRATPSSGPSCPLSVSQQAKAVKAFREMMPVFHHPRCVNRHGGVTRSSSAPGRIRRMRPLPSLEWSTEAA